MQCANTLVYMGGDVTKAPISNERPHISLKEGWLLIFWVKGRINYQCFRGSQINHVGQFTPQCHQMHDLGWIKLKAKSLDKKWATFIMMPTLHQMLHIAWNLLRWRAKQSNLIILLDYYHTKKILIDHYTNFIQRWCIKGKEIWDLIHKYGATFCFVKNIEMKLQVGHCLNGHVSIGAITWQTNIKACNTSSMYWLNTLKRRVQIMLSNFILIMQQIWRTLLKF
jgi:hypothetical protein